METSFLERLHTKMIVYPTRNLSIEVARQVTSASIDGRRHQSLALPPSHHLLRPYGSARETEAVSSDIRTETCI